MKNRKKILIFTNCHGEYYKNYLERNTNLSSFFEIEHILSYENLNNFLNIQKKFEEADILIISNIKEYPDFRIENIKKVIKKDCFLIIIPFIRFEGYWPNKSWKKMNYFTETTIHNFPDISFKEIDSYLAGEEFTREEIIKNFNKCLVKLKELEKEGDVLFYDFLLGIIKNPLYLGTNGTLMSIS
jgi:hypothetical protein